MPCAGRAAGQHTAQRMWGEAGSVFWLFIHADVCSSLGFAQRHVPLCLLHRWAESRIYETVPKVILAALLHLQYVQDVPSARKPDTSCFVIVTQTSVTLPTLVVVRPSQQQSSMLATEAQATAWPAFQVILLVILMVIGFRWALSTC